MCDNLWGCELESGLSVRIGAWRDSGLLTIYLWGEVNGEPAILRFAISEEEHERALTLVSATSRRAPPVESDEDEDEDEEAGGAPAAATALGPPPRRLMTLRHGRKVPAVKYF